MVIKTFIVCILLFIANFTTPTRVYSFGDIKNTIQNEFDQNPFLKKQGIKLKVVDAKDGYITIDMYLGNQNIRKAIFEGIDIQEGDSLLRGISNYDSQDVLVIKEAIATIKSRKDVKQVLLTASYYDGTIMIPEKGMTEKFFLKDNNIKKYFGFKIRVDNIDNEYRSDVTILEGDKEVLHESIEPWKPLVYKKYIFYVSSYTPYNDFKVQIKNNKTNKSTFVQMPYQKKVEWEEDNSSWGILNAEAEKESPEKVKKAKIWFSGKKDSTWCPVPGEIIIANYEFKISQYFGVGLHVIIDESK